MTQPEGLNLLRLLRRWERDQRSSLNAVLASLEADESYFWDVFDALRDALLDRGELVECGSCGATHSPQYGGDCRNDDERF